MRILLADNYDSFTFNLKHQLVMVCGCSVDVIRHDEIDMGVLEGYSGVVISPGPGNPDDYKSYSEILDCDLPVLGICLGMQIINSYYGGSFTRLNKCVHGQAVRISYFGKAESVAVYNSLYCSEIPECFEVYADMSGIPMAIRHKSEPRCGLQFHPESFLTKNGDEILKDALKFSGIIK